MSNTPTSNTQNMKAALAALLACASALTLAQTDDVNRINTAYGNLRQFPGIDLQVWGTQKIGGQNTDLGALIEWPWDEANPQPMQKITVREYRNGGLINKTVGDGTTLWSLNLLKNEYVAHNYGTYNGAEPDEYRLDLIQHFNALSHVPANYAARLLREMYGATDPAFRSWVPGATVTVVNDTGTPKTDPVTNRVYTPVPNSKDYVMYELSGPVNRSVVFERTMQTMPDGSQGWCLSDVYVGEASPSTSLDLDLTTTALTTAPSDSDFAFIPPIGAKPIEGSMLNGK